jgi:hypothetical protein
MMLEKESSSTSPPPIFTVPSEGDLPVDGNARSILVTESPNTSRERQRILIVSIVLVVLVLIATIIGLSVALTSKSSNIQSNLSDDSSKESSSCPNVPEGGCSVCGTDNCIHNPNHIFSFPGQPSVSCSTLQNAGYSGMITQDQCWMLQDLIRNLCDCHSSSKTNDSSLTPQDFERRTLEAIAWIIKQGYSSSDSLQNSLSPQRLAVQFMVESTITSFELPTTDTSQDDINLWKERYVLAVFYFSLNGPNWLNENTFLNPSASNCDWNSPVILPTEIKLEGAECANSIFITHLTFCKFTLESLIFLLNKSIYVFQR